ncbi:hypothetical protein JCM19294_1151 [Nonlabens tegetincola]|uniref:Uncharacterized protein n=2 Tax=Nonlabens tegetincola TaxID=323273 RepID=A0A090Q3R9_9FLAO|nr:hypothetical protein JCM19294_1151 [Nonlabens tegetincola]
MSPAVFRHFFGTWPGTKMEKVTLLHTYKLSVYVVDDHTTVLDCLIAHTNLKNKRDENKLSK